MISSVSEIHLGLWKVNAHFVLQKASEVENIGVPDFGTNVIGQNPNIEGCKWGGHNKQIIWIRVFAVIHLLQKKNHS